MFTKNFNSVPTLTTFFVPSKGSSYMLGWTDLINSDDSYDELDGYSDIFDTTIYMEELECLNNYWGEAKNNKKRVCFWPSLVKTILRNQKLKPSLQYVA